MAIRDRLKHAWNAFTSPDENTEGYGDPLGGGGYGVVSSSTRPDKVRTRFSNERSIISSVYTRLSIDIASVDIRHVRLDDARRYLEDMDSGLNECLTVEANIDQAATHLRQDIVSSLFDTGCIAVVPVEVTVDPRQSSGYDIRNLRVGRIVDWKPQRVKVSLYDERDGKRKEIWLDKKFVAIVENPLYMVMNEPNSTLQRLIRKLNLLDSVDEAAASGKLDLIIQLPYVIKTETKKQQAEQRRDNIEMQLKDSRYGIAYTDATEKITQLNRPAENNLLTQIEYLAKMLYGQLGLTEEVMNGTADEATMLNYHHRTIAPILDAVVEGMRRSFLTKTARSQGQWIMYFRDPFKLVPIGSIAEIGDKFTRNEIMSSNEMRQIVGLKPRLEPKADELRNSNMPQSELGTPPPGGEVVPGEVVASEEDPEAVVNDAFDGVNETLDSIFSDLGVPG